MIRECKKCHTEIKLVPHPAKAVHVFPEHINLKTGKECPGAGKEVKDDEAVESGVSFVDEESAVGAGEGADGGGGGEGEAAAEGGEEAACG